MPEVVTLGEAMVLLVTEPPRPLRAARSFQRSIAGAESNVAIGVTRLGRTAGWIGRVGDDPFGHGILDVLRGEGVDVSRAVVDAAAPTGLLVRDRHAERPIHVLYYRDGSAGSRLRPDDVDEEYLSGARFLHLTGITPALSESARAAVLRAAEVAADAGVRISLDPNLRLKLWSAPEAAAALPPLIAHADVVFAGREEASLLSQRAEPEAAAEWFLENGAGLVVVKRGANGSWATDGTTTWSAPAYPVTAVDVVGAGDAFVAGYLAATLDDLGTEAALRAGNAAGALSIQVPGDVEGLPHLPDLLGLQKGAADVNR